MGSGVEASQKVSNELHSVLSDDMVSVVLVQLQVLMLRDHGHSSEPEIRQAEFLLAADMTPFFSGKILHRVVIDMK